MVAPVEIKTNVVPVIGRVVIDDALVRVVSSEKQRSIVVYMLHVDADVVVELIVTSRAGIEELIEIFVVVDDVDDEKEIRDVKEKLLVLHSAILEHEIDDVES